MKKTYLKIIEKILAVLARATIKKYNPKVVGITGSVGKTSAKDAVAHVLKTEYRVRKSKGNYNNELGVPLTILDLQTTTSPMGWFLNFLKALLSLVVRIKYPEVLVLEMAADKPGDIKYLKTIVKPHISIITNIGPSHLEFYESVGDIAKEKGELLTDLSLSDFAVLNIDNKLVKAMTSFTKANIMTFGFADEAAVKAEMFEDWQIFSDQALASKDRLEGLKFKIAYRGNIVPVQLNNALGRPQVYAALAAFACGAALDINLVQMAQALSNLKPPKGRLNLISGVKKSLLIDDTYNSSPESTLNALEVLSRIVTTGRKIAILGDMLELGVYTEEGHRKVGQEVAEYGFDYLITIGDRSRFTAEAAKVHNMPVDKIKEFENSMEAGKYMQSILEEKDVILVKGSQGARMEKVVKELMLEPLKAGELLVRQEEAWEDKP